MRDAQRVNVARAQIGVMLKQLPPGSDPKMVGALHGVYSALSWVLELPNKPAAQMERLLGGRAGELLPPPAALDLQKLAPDREN